jgi:hypothetical protein
VARRQANRQGEARQEETKITFDKGQGLAHDKPKQSPSGQRSFMKYEYELIVERHSYPDNPRDCDWQENDTKMVCFHPQYKLGDKHSYRQEDYESWEELENAIMQKENVAKISPLYLYDHGAITIRTRPFSCSWDSGQVGFVYITQQSSIDCGYEGSLDELIEQEVNRYDCYLTGNVYRYSIYEVEKCSSGQEHKTCVDSVGDFYDEVSCKTTGEAEMEALQRQVSSQR